MVNAILTLFKPRRFIGPGKPPKRWDNPNEPKSTLFTKEFVLLFLMAMCSNSFIAVYYCFEQWLDTMGVAPDWRGVLISSLFAMLLIFRPLTSIIMLKHGKLWPMTISLAVSALVMLSYPFVIRQYAVPIIMALRLIQGVALAVYLAGTVSVLVECIPPGQSAKGFALFSLTTLLPYSIIPAMSEELIPLVGGEAHLFAWMASLAAPSFLMIFLMAKKLKKPEIDPALDSGKARKSLFHAITHSGLGFVYLACTGFGITTILAIFFMKGLASAHGEHAAWFFTTYSITIILVRVLGSQLMDTLPRHRVSVLCSLVLAGVMASFAWCPAGWFLILSAIYGLSIGLLYPLLAAAIYDRSTPETRSVNSNVMMATFDASGMLGPIFGGLVIAQGWGYKGVFLAASVFAASCGFWMIADFVRIHIQKRKTALS